MTGGPPHHRRRHRRSALESGISRAARTLSTAAAVARGVREVASQTLTAATQQARADLSARPATGDQHVAGSASRPAQGVRAALGPGSQTARTPARQQRTGEYTSPVTGSRLLEAWKRSDTGAATDLSHLPAPAQDDPPVRLMGTLPDYSFWVGADIETPEVLRVQAIWERALVTDMAPTLRRAVNDWNRDHVWPLVWTLPTATGLTVQAACHLDTHQGATDAELVMFLDTALSSIDAFFTALDTATASATDSTDATDEGPLDPGM